MKTPYERSNGYRLRAEELRAITANLSEPTAERILRRIAAHYERLADQVDEIWSSPRKADPPRAAGEVAVDVQRGTHQSASADQNLLLANALPEPDLK